MGVVVAGMNEKGDRVVVDVVEGGGKKGRSIHSCCCSIGTCWVDRHRCSV